MLEAFSFIEVSIRTQWAHQLAYAFGHGEQAHLNAALFDDNFYTDNLQKLKRSYNQIGNQQSADFNTLPIWDVIHAMSFGQLSKWYSSLNDLAIRQSISQKYEMEQSVFRSALRHLTKVRNICAHHERLWDLGLSTALKIPNQLVTFPETPKAFNPKATNKVYNVIVMTTHLMEVVTPNGDWAERFLEFMTSDSHQSVPKNDMGFPTNWQNFDIWQRHMPAGE